MHCSSTTQPSTHHTRCCRSTPPDRADSRSPTNGFRSWTSGTGQCLRRRPDDFLNDVNSIGIGSRDDSHNFDLVGLGNVICWRLYTGEATGQIAAALVTGSGSDGRAEVSHDQVDAAVGFAITDLCPDAAPK